MKKLKLRSRKFIGECTINATLVNTARALRWLAPRVQKRFRTHGSIARVLLDDALFLDGIARRHAKKVLYRAAKKR